MDILKLKCRICGQIKSYKKFYSTNNYKKICYKCHSKIAHLFQSRAKRYAFAVIKNKLSNTKKCTRCGIRKSLSKFYKLKSGKYGVHSICKKCMLKYEKEKRKEIYRKNINVRYKIRRAKYSKEHAGEIKARQAKYSKEHAGEIKARQAKYRKQHAGEIKARRAKYSKEHAGEIKARRAKYSKEHAGEIKAQRAKYIKEHAGEIKARKAKYIKEQVENLTDKYLISMLLRKFPDITREEIKSHPELIKLKRIEIQNIRIHHQNLKS